MVLKRAKSFWLAEAVEAEFTLVAEEVLEDFFIMVLKHLKHQMVPQL